MSARIGLRSVLSPLRLSSRPCVTPHRALPLARASFHSTPLSRQGVVPSSSSEQPKVQLQDRKLRMTFTCTAPNCTSPGVRSTHEFSRLAYEKGIVLVQCPGCQTRHLIADHLGWFDSDDLTQGGKYRTIEDLMRAKGETVKYGQYLVDENKAEGDTVSFVPEEKA